MNRYFAFNGLPGTFVLTVLLSLLAFVSALIKPSTARWLCLGAMLMSSVGDIFLTRFNGIERLFPNYFVWGAGAFMIAHIIYTLAYRTLAKANGLSFFNGGVIIAILIALASLAYAFYACISRHSYANLPLAVIYLVIIGINCATIFSYGWGSFAQRPWAILAAVGAFSFFVSDLIIGIGMLAGITRFDYLIWWLYPIGQILIILFCR